MIYVETNSSNDKVIFKHNVPFDKRFGLGKTKDELLDSGYLLEKGEPEPEKVEGMESKLYYNPDRGFWYEYTEIPPTQEEKIDKLQNDIDYLILKQEGLI